MVDEQYEREVELIDYIEVILKRKVLIAAVTVLCGMAVGSQSLLSARAYESQALVVVSQPIASTRTSVGDEHGAGPLGTEIKVSGLAAQTYQALAKGDELIQALRDNLINSEALAAEARDVLRNTPFERISQSMLASELLEETQKADSPLLAFRVSSSLESLPVPMVNLWTQLFMERHRGLSSNVADSHYQWVQQQYDTAQRNLQSTEDALRELTTSYSELSILETELGIKTQHLDSALIVSQKLATELESKERELDFARRQLAQVTQGGRWLGYLELDRLPTQQAASPGPAMQRQLVSLRRDQEGLVADSLALQEDHDARRREYGAKKRSQILAFERQTGIERRRGREAELDSTLSAFRLEASRLDQEIKEVGLDLEVYGKNRELEPRVHSVAKAIVDEELWQQAASRRGVDEGVQRELGRYRLVSESLNPTYQSLTDRIRDMQIRYDRATTRISFLEAEIPVLEEELGVVRVHLDSLVELESQLLHRLERERVGVEDSLARQARPVHENLSLKRSALAAQRQIYVDLKRREDDLERAITSLRSQVGYRREDFDEWSAQVRRQGTRADSLARMRRTLEQELEVYQGTFERFANLLEETRIARQQAAGDIQIVSKAVVARPVPRGTVKKTAIAAIVGLMGSVMLAFLLEYVARARAEKATETG